MNTIVALDIGTENVKVALAQPKKGTLAILGTGTAKQSPGSMSSGAITDIPAVVASCERALVAAEEAAETTAKLVVVGIAGELIKSNTTTVSYHRKNPNKPITESEIENIIEQVQQKSGDSARQIIALETGNDDIEIRLINSAIVSLTIDGYKINNPIGFKGTEIILQFYTAFAPLLHIAAIEKVCAELNLELLTIAVEPFAVCRAFLGENFDNDFSGVLVDIGSSTTDLAVISDGCIEGTETFNIGFKKADTAVSTWLSGVEIALEEFSTVETLPGKLYLCGGGANSANIQESLALSDWYQSLPFLKRPVINLVDIQKLPDYTFESTPDQSFTTALGLLRVGTDTLMSAPEENKLKNKISKLLQN